MLIQRKGGLISNLRKSFCAVVVRVAQVARVLRWMTIAALVLQTLEITAQVVNRPPRNDPRRNNAFRSDQILVKPRPGAAQAQLANLHAGINGRVAKTYLREQWLLVRLPPGKQVKEALAHYRASPLIEHAEPDFVVHAFITPNDPRYLDGSQWPLNNTGQNNGTNDADIDAPEAWDIRRFASEIVVAVLDTGIRTTHEDLSDNLRINPGEWGTNSFGQNRAVNGVDDDGNGYVDDVYGINAILGNGLVSDDHGHGSHVSGIIGAVGDNGKGICGVAWRVKLLACKFLGTDGSGNTSDAIECIEYAQRQGANIINASWGSTDFSQALADAIEIARQAGILFVAAAGNNSADTDTFPQYPASFPHDNIVSVAALDRNDALAPYSNYGLGSVDAGAPGSDILSCSMDSDSSYVAHSGTSMAAPHVVGVLALMMAQFPSDTRQQLLNRLYASVDSLPSLTGRCRSGGRINLAKALRSTSTRPFNDDFTNAPTITANSFRVRGSTVDATAETGEPSHAGLPPGQTVWWKWTPGVRGIVVMETTNTTFDTVLAVYTGDQLATLQPIAANDNKTNSVTDSAVEFETPAGVTYQIAVMGAGTQSGTFQVVATFIPRPVNDNFTNATAITGSEGATIHASTVAATREANEPAHAGQSGGRSVWWSWTAAANGIATITTAGSLFDTLLAVYTGSSLASLTVVASSDNSSQTDRTSGVQFDAIAGTTYLIAVDGVDGASGEVILNTPPLNDDFTNRIVLNNTLFNSVGYTTLATREPQEPTHSAGSVGNSIWWSWVAPSNGPVSISTEGSSFDTILAIYTGTSLATLSLVATNDNANGAPWSKVFFSAAAGVTYQIAVDGRSGSPNGQSGRVVLAGGFGLVLNDMGAPSEDWQTWAAGVNNHNQVVGHASDSQDNDERAFLWTPTNGLALLSTLPSTAEAINDAGQIAGQELDRPVVWQNGQKTQLEGPGAGYAINSSGQVVGVTYLPDRNHAALWRDGILTDLGTLPGHWGSHAYGINDHGDVVGHSYPATVPGHAFLWRDGVMVDLGTLPGHTVSTAYAINNQGDIVGYSGVNGPTEAVLWHNGAMIQLESGRKEGSTIRAFAFNDHGQIVGQAGFDAVLWIDGHLHILQDILPQYTNDWLFFAANAINDSGFIAGSGARHFGGDDRGRGFLLSPAATASLLPRLDYTRAGTTLNLSWPASFTNFVLEYSPTVPGGSWSTSALPVRVIDGRANVAVEPSDPKKFFRLRRWLENNQ